jgi:hypothetical protein
MGKMSNRTLSQDEFRTLQHTVTASLALANALLNILNGEEHEATTLFMIYMFKPVSRLLVKANAIVYPEEATRAAGKDLLVADRLHMYNELVEYLAEINEE